MDKILHDLKDSKLWELWYIAYYGSCRILSINRILGVPYYAHSIMGTQNPILLVKAPTVYARLWFSGSPSLPCDAPPKHGL